MGGVNIQGGDNFFRNNDTKSLQSLQFEHSKLFCFLYWKTLHKHRSMDFPIFGKFRRRSYHKASLIHRGNK